MAGAAHRQWLAKSNPQLSRLLTDCVGEDFWLRDLEMLSQVNFHSLTNEETSFRQRWRELRLKAKARNNLSHAMVVVNPLLFEESSRLELFVYAVLWNHNYFKDTLVPNFSVQYLVTAPLPERANSYETKLLMLIMAAVEKTANSRVQLRYMPVKTISEWERLVTCVDFVDQT